MQFTPICKNNNFYLLSWLNKIEIYIWMQHRSLNRLGIKGNRRSSSWIWAINNVWNLFLKCNGTYWASLDKSFIIIHRWRSFNRATLTISFSYVTFGVTYCHVWLAALGFCIELYDHLFLWCPIRINSTKLYSRP